MHLRQVVSLVAILFIVSPFLNRPDTAKAEDIQFVSLTAFAEMQDRLDEMEFRLSSVESTGGGHVVDPTSAVKGSKGGKGFSCGTCTSPGVTIDLEVLFLRPYGSDDGDFNTDKYNAGTRLTAGCVREDGLGIQFRGFIYGIDTIDVKGHFDAYYLDLEITDKFRLGCWDGTLSGGVRYADFNQPGNTDGMRGWGPEVGVSMSRRVLGNLYFVGTGRYSILFGDEQWEDEDDTWNITELQLATEYRRDGWAGSEWFARVGLEAQYWSAVASDDDEDMGLVGAAFAFGITR